jgi:molybdopterin-guanine dinucleotide biosynthesis protein A
MNPEITGGLLAGGKSRRFGADKALAPWRGRPLIAHAAGALAALCGRVVLLTNDPGAYAFLGLETVPDLRPGKGPLAGLEAALAAARTPWVLLAACDMPCLSARLLARMIQVKNGYKAVIPEGERGPEPLCALYHRGILPEVRAMLDNGRLAIGALAGIDGVRVMPAAEVREADANALIFANVNRPGDLQRLPGAGEKGR